MPLCNFRWVTDLNNRWHPEHTCVRRGVHTEHVCHVNYFDQDHQRRYCGVTKRA